MCAASPTIRLVLCRYALAQFSLLRRNSVIEPAKTLQGLGRSISPRSVRRTASDWVTPTLAFVLRPCCFEQVILMHRDSSSQASSPRRHGILAGLSLHPTTRLLPLSAFAGGMIRLKVLNSSHGMRRILPQGFDSDLGTLPDQHPSR